MKSEDVVDASVAARRELVVAARRQLADWHRYVKSHGEPPRHAPAEVYLAGILLWLSEGDA